MSEGDVLTIVSGHQAFAAPVTPEGLTGDELAAIQAADSPSAENPFTTGAKTEVIGPFAVAFDDTGLVNPVTPLGKAVGPAIAEGSVVVSAWAQPRSTAIAWDGGLTPTLWVYLADGNLAASNAQVCYVGDISSEQSAGPYRYPYARTEDQQDHAVANAASQLIVAVYTSGGSITAGTADIYALIQSA